MCVLLQGSSGRPLRGQPREGSGSPRDAQGSLFHVQPGRGQEVTTPGPRFPSSGAPPPGLLWNGHAASTQGAFREVFFESPPWPVVCSSILGSVSVEETLYLSLFRSFWVNIL